MMDRRIYLQFQSGCFYLELVVFEVTLAAAETTTITERGDEYRQHRKIIAAPAKEK